MRKWLSHILRLALVLGAAVTLAACGGAGSGATSVDTGDGGELAPTGGGGTPVAIEIPALGDVSGLPFASGVVVTGSSNVAVALKATPSSWVYKTFTLDDDNAFTTGDSLSACEYRNSAGILVGTWALPDQALCLIKNNVASFTSPDDGNYHILATGAAFPGFPSKIKFKITKDPYGTITNYEEFTCDSTGVQLTYVAYVIDGTAMTATLKTIQSAEPQRTQVDLTATLNSDAAFTAKAGAVAYTGSNDSGAIEGKINATQGATYLLLDGFDSRGDGGNVLRLIGQADQSNTTSPLAISGYTFGAGAASLVDNGTLSSECWDISNDPTTCAGANFTAIEGQTPLTASSQTVSDFSGTTAWSCDGTVEVTSTDSMEDASSCFSLFRLESNHIDCTSATQGSLTVTPSFEGTTLSTDSNNATRLFTTPTLLLTASRALDTSSTNSTTVTLVNNSNANDTVSLTFTNWNSGSTVLTLSPTLTAGVTYKLTLVGSSTTASRGTVIRSPEGEPPNDQMQSTATYYIRAQ